MKLLHRLLRLVLPREFRRRHGAGMEEAFLDALRDARGSGRKAILWLREAIDLAATGARLRRRRAARRAAATGAGQVHGHVHGSERGRRRGGGMGSFTTWTDDARHAWRSMVRRPVFALFAAGTLALGVGATTAIFSAVETVVLNPLPYPDSDRLVTIWRVMGSGMFVQPEGDLVRVLEEREDLFEDIVVFRSRSDVTLTGTGDPVHLFALQVEEDFDEFLGLDPALGRGFTEEEVDREARVAVLSHDLWRTRLGGDAAALGRTLSLNGEPYAVVGVLPPHMPAPNALSRRVDLWLPLSPEHRLASPTLVARRPEALSPEALQERLDAVVAQAVETGVIPQAWKLDPRPVVEMASGGLRENLRVLMIAVVILLLIACVNVANLLLSRGFARRRETGVRLALGAGRGRLVRQMLLESLLLSAVGGALGLAIAWGVVEGMVALSTGPGQSGNRGLAVLDAVRLNRTVLAFAVTVALASGALFGVVAGVQGSTARHLARLAGAPRGSDGGGRFRWGLVAGEVALSFSLLVGAVLVLGSLARLWTTEPGFEAGRAGAMEVEVPAWKYEGEARTQAYERLRERLATLPGVTHVTWAGGIPPEMGIIFGTVEVEGREPEDDNTIFHGGGVDAGFFETLGVPLLRGRGFTPEEVREGAEVVVLGEAAASRLFPQGDAVGRRLRLGGGEWSVVVGVAADVASHGLSGERPDMQMYQPLSYAGSWLAVRVAQDVAPALAAARQVVERTEPDAVVLQVTGVDAMMRASLRREIFTTTLLGAFALLAVILSAVGLYGVVSQVVGQRTREFGIRLSLGARAAQVRAMVLRQGLVATTAGVLAGMLLAWAGLRVLQSRVFGLDEGAIAPAFAAAALVLSAMTLLACWIPARRAARVDPTEALRVE